LIVMLCMEFRVQPAFPRQGIFEPDMLAVLYRAFDDVWSELRSKTDPAVHEVTRNAIATALMQAALGGELDPAKLRSHAMGRARALSSLYWIANQAAAAPSPPPHAPA
jgi:hypothetical protein